MKNFLDSLLKIAFGAFFVLTSVYCLLAFLPYTYYAVIKAPTYSWIPWFARHHVLLFWLASLAGAVAYRDRKKTIAYIASFGLLAGLGVFLFVHPLLVHIENNQSAYWEAIAALWIAILVVSACGLKTQAAPANEDTSHAPLSFLTGLVLALGLALLNIAATHSVQGAKPSIPDASNIAMALAVWSVAWHILAALVFVAIVNLVWMASARTWHPHATRRTVFCLLTFGLLWVLSVHFLENALSMNGWQPHLYAISLAAALTLPGFSVLRPLLARTRPQSRTRLAWQIIVSVVVLVALVFLVFAVPGLIGTEDWNGFFHGTVTLVIWIGAGACLFRLLPRARSYSAKLVFESVLLGALTLGVMVKTDVVWSWALGDTGTDIQQALVNYADRDPSFNMAYHLLGNGYGNETCNAFCGILRRYSNIHDARARFDVKLVDPLVRTQGKRPNIFFFVIDSMRPDYLGAYNPKADFTPNMDALARDSVVLHNVYSPYAGTSLSEPAIWAGTLLLHAHYMQPFARVNGLEKLVKTDDYQIVVSDDDVLREILSPSDDMIKLDTKEPWPQQELCSTVQQAEKIFVQRADPKRPIFFYTQPKNVHQLARNNLPKVGNSNFSAPSGFDRIIAFEVHQVDACLGGFFGWLKARNLYDDSIIIVTSDHGQATGEFGRKSHSTIIYPQDMRVPLIVHLPKLMQGKYVHDDSRVSALIDVTPSLYYLLGHRPIIKNPLFGRPLFAGTQDELHAYPRKDLFMASDVLAAYGILGDNGRYFYATYASPAKSYLYDLERDPNGTHDILTDALNKQYQERVIERLHQIADFYGYVPGEEMLRTPAPVN